MSNTAKEPSRATQLGFLVDLGRCVQCEACVAACKASHHLERGIRWRRVITYWQGAFPSVRNRSFTVSCQHCEHPACVEACPSSALVKRSQDGVVRVDRDACSSCRACGLACPYGAIQFGVDEFPQKCDFCSSRLEQDLAPSCVATCPAEALRFGTTDDLAAVAESVRVAGELSPALFVVPSRQAWDANAFYKVLSRAAEPSVPTALTVIVER